MSFPLPSSPLAQWVGTRRLSFFIGSVVLLFLLPKMWLLLLRCRSAIKPEETNALRGAFSSIYSSAKWGRNKDGKGHSGAGSTEEATDNFRLLLEDFLRQRNIRSVVDAGCGDWEWTQFVDWRPVEEYTGVDVVPSVIARNQDLYSSHNRTFHARSILKRDNLPPADLLMSKDVLQHLPTPMVHQFIANHLSAHDGRYKYKYALLTNDRCNVTRLHRRCVDNRDLGQPGGWREVNLALPPFSLPAFDFYRWPHHWWDDNEREKVTVLMDFTRV
ncbi:unnamed protein product [Vitrella brassicaformis CCMP3155]|uniref:Methyltransferase domain-containing protein n=1 Tax=Vitrella brassicaformis (strain CCMP3155) TaxID=1169540 RepID=A0A0G4EL66_VITBC|nr:unnamed protein product [Vitrella brassicaformis CCMP3155]|eukprot:CEL97136.1 unnamed protein product [Vitrella brassicaformis CCMP3155]